MIALEVCRILASSEYKISVLGLLMIDSVCPWAKAHPGSGRIRPSFRPTTKQAVKDKVVASFENASRMISEWKQPVAFTLPPAAMIRATETMPIANSSDGLQPSKDHDWNLGWSEFTSVKFRRVVDVPGNHFSMFDDDRVSYKLSAQKICIILTLSSIQA